MKETTKCWLRFDASMIIIMMKQCEIYWILSVDNYS